MEEEKTVKHCPLCPELKCEDCRLFVMSGMQGGPKKRCTIQLIREDLVRIQSHLAVSPL